jgi:hypothetical protein
MAAVALAARQERALAARQERALAARQERARWRRGSPAASAARAAAVRPGIARVAVAVCAILGPWPLAGCSLASRAD